MIETATSNYTHTYRGERDGDGAPLFECSDCRVWRDENGVALDVGWCPHLTDDDGGPVFCLAPTGGL
jgi:hypothetical protein